MGKGQNTETITKQLDTVVSQLQRKNAKVAFFVGAGISTNCGIPDFRSPKTGLYSNLRKLNLPYPEAVFDIDYFRKKPKAFYTLAEELFPGKFVPSKFHYFIKLCQDKGILKRCYTQNIDTLERIAGVSDDKVLEAHGSFCGNHCIECSEEMPREKLRAFMDQKKIPTCANCEGYVKPDIVFFGEALPDKLWEFWEEDIDDIDVAIVAGTSLAVYPFASLPAEVGKKANRILINREKCGDFDTNPRKSDIVLLKDCDIIAELLCEKLGWSEDLEALWLAGNKSVRGKPENEVEPSSSQKDKAAATATEIAEKVEAGLEYDKNEEKNKRDKVKNKENDEDVDVLAGVVKKISIT
ncbi:hypothetical protein PICMEDRAFT_72824 [Pichia membranifaciens NRRL Y-2026]|uniref:NAD-dependent protein deacetylase n=1 Tax=Pichia membranifaciens NRRL Y-2026 TaxID=763406 RepID=A0A1E3NKX1_9ASCO|nr:hypothetical protein PICMEDRAFT_72824 [Pichia membranifaciens NRRL Y-2026]ODQ46787.1 hypothetical protein PICMEDRAFT_72824 [Pichia membranifaciens NRRL Y-2026]